MRAKRNTKREIKLNFLMYKEKEHYVAFCTELALVREGKDPLKLKNRIERVADKYVENIIEHKLSEDLLNQSLPEKYMQIFDSRLEQIEQFKKRELEIKNPPSAVNWNIPKQWPRTNRKNSNLAIA